MDQPPWMAEAWLRLGAREVPGRRHNKEILDFFREAGRGDVVRDEVPWCAAFVGASLKRAGIRGTGSLLARSYLEWGQPIAEPRVGAVVVLTRGSNPSAGHVGFWLGETNKGHVLLGGNQSNAVTVDTFAKRRLLGFRWPSDDVSDDDDKIGRVLFEAALAHVLKMEGGFNNDPHDPGGPTNKGIILEVFARHTGQPLNESTRERLIADLRTIDDAIVRDIYASRYWRPSHAAEMPAAVGFMHFDASVNHGLTGAARLLQRALKPQHPNLDVDGEIGPITLEAVEISNQPRLLHDYAETRREKYRALHHFWRFGRGWLARVDKTLAAAERILKRAAPKPSKPKQSKPKKGQDMPQQVPGTEKWWGASMTVWGALITALSTVVPVLGPAIGLNVTPDLVHQVGEQVVHVVQAIGGLLGTVMTIYGRARAQTTLRRREFAMQF